MVYNKFSESVIVNGRRYEVGMSVLANEKSAYYGLYGTILEICTDEAPEKKSKTPEIVCSFDTPVLPEEVRTLEARFAILRGAEVTLKDVALDCVVMAPDMLVPLDNLLRDRKTLSIWAVVEDWSVDEESGHNEILYADKEDAARVFYSQLSVEANEGCIERWKGRNHFQSDQGDLFYECWLDGEYLCNHYEIRVEEKRITLPHNWESFCRSIDANQYARLLTVLTDNGVEADETGVVAEAIGFVLELDMSKASEE